jgi:hypothetical protein
LTAYIEPAETRDGLVDEMAHLILAPYVGFDEGSLRTKGAQFGLERLAFGFAPTRGDDRRAAFGKSDSGGAADPGQRAGNEDNGSILAI